MDILNTLTNKGWNLLAEEVSFPIAVINEKYLLNNAKWMQEFSDKSFVKLAPHGKTSMAPDLFKVQLEQGCWGISLATVPQVINASQHGISRIILANQLVGLHHMQLIADLLSTTDPNDSRKWLIENNQRRRFADLSTLFAGEFNFSKFKTFDFKIIKQIPEGDLVD